MSPLNALNWRYAVKQFANTTLHPQQLEPLLEAIRLSPGAFGLQPYRLLLISNPELRSNLLLHSMGQNKVTKASHLLVFAAVQQIDEAFVADHIECMTQQRGGTAEEYQGLEAHLNGYFRNMSDQEKVRWADQQVFLALGNCLTSAALLGIDSCPMTGFNPEGYDQVLGLAEQGLRSVATCALGERHAEDAAADLPKVRLPAQVLTRVLV
ncbi:NAD(P)H-dependent oxidoreductase [Marinobacterium marinum]|uniref:NAD(P)H-dependent oxidoreductase n=1 Tax=Marinobacterium marinum TaxID=2756129 RepID=A0A7W2ACL9_9GAMM|nr:NAD(P)H-dependent oxidoreductase [Marinobacterium marinum]MBA4502677.1 NAD(P)H-dependent oxidoreductase [Marinobacterium marinum]